MNRGLARRTVFETEGDIRFFLSRVARAVHAGILEVHAYCVLSTHFHLLVRSPAGELAEAMRKIQNEYVRWFNRTRRRDGPLFRGRYRSRVVDSLDYRHVVVRYIDANPVSARLVPDARLYPHGSARWYARESGPIWLSREWVEAFVRACNGADAYRTEHYPRTFGGTLSPSIERLVERRWKHVADEKDPLGEILSAAPGRVLQWMRRKAALADGTSVGLPIADMNDAIEVVRRARERGGEWRIHTARRSFDVWPQVLVAMLRDLCAATFAEAATRAHITEGAAWKAYRRHQACMQDDPYAQRLTSLARQLMEEYGVGAIPQRFG